MKVRIESLLLVSALFLCLASPLRSDTVDIDLSGFSAFSGFHGNDGGPNSGVSVDIGAGSEITAIEFIDLSFNSHGGSWRGELALSVNDDDGIPDGALFDLFWDYVPSSLQTPGTYGPTSGSFGEFPDQEDGGSFVASSGNLWITIWETFGDDESPDATISSGTLRIHFSPATPTGTEGFVYHSSWVGDPKVDTSKSLAIEGEGRQTLSYNNLINTSQGINGLLFEFGSLPMPATLTVGDFTFQASPQGNFDEGLNPPSSWGPAPAPSAFSVTVGSPTTALVQWPNNSIENRWLRVTIAANANTGLPSPKTFYLGHLMGETTGPSGSQFSVSFADVAPIRADIGLVSDITSITDIDKSGSVSFADISAMRANIGSELTIISIQ